MNLTVAMCCIVQHVALVSEMQHFATRGLDGISNQKSNWGNLPTTAHRKCHVPSESCANDGLFKNGRHALQEKKSGRISVNLTHSDKSEIENIATEMGLSAGGLGTKLIESYLEQKRTLGTRLIWPPEFNHYPETAKSAQEEIDSKIGIDPANVSSKRKAG